MLDAVVPAALEHVQRAVDVAPHVGVRILQRIAHAGLRGEMHHARELLAREQRRNRRGIGEIELHEAETRVREALQARLLERHVVVVVEIVEADDLVARLQQPRAVCKPMKPAAPVTRIFTAGRRPRWPGKRA